MPWRTGQVTVNAGSPVDIIFIGSATWPGLAAGHTCDCIDLFAALHHQTGLCWLRQVQSGPQLEAAPAPPPGRSRGEVLSVLYPLSSTHTSPGYTLYCNQPDYIYIVDISRYLVLVPSTNIGDATIVDIMINNQQSLLLLHLLQRCTIVHLC